MQLNPTFVTNVHDLYGEEGNLWLRDLSHTLNKLSTLWNFQFIKPMASLSYNFVGLVKMCATNKTAILKMSPKGGNLNNEMRWLHCIEKGMPEVYMFDESWNAYLMEHLEPGRSLKTLVKEGNDDDATRIICATIRSLQSQHCSNANFRHLSDFSKSFHILDGKFDARLLSKAKSLYHELTQDRENDIVLHGDLHHDNILSCQSGWKAIDPHGYVGAPAAEVGTMIRNPLDCFPKDKPLLEVVSRRFKILSEELPFDAQHIRDWAFCITVLSAAWSVEGHGKVENIEIEVATAIDQVK